MNFHKEDSYSYRELSNLANDKDEILDDDN